MGDNFLLGHQKIVKLSGGIMETTIVTLTLTTVVSFLALLVGGMIGW